jgi:hypothetical protein
LFVIWVQARELLEAGAHVSVEGAKGLSMEAGGHGSDGIHHFAKAAAVAQQQQSHLRVGQFPQGTQERQRLVNSSLGVLVAERRGAYGSTKKLTVPIADNLDGGG